jgi:hypothetical protein
MAHDAGSFAEDVRVIGVLPTSIGKQCTEQPTVRVVIPPPLHLCDRALLQTRRATGSPRAPLAAGPLLKTSRHW